jgi:hypothetical protein
MKILPRNPEARMRKLRIFEHISIDCVILATSDSTNFSYNNRTTPVGIFLTTYKVDDL